MKNTFHMVSDASHGWLKVPMEELVRLKIADNITQSSYTKGSIAFLEQDADLATFTSAREAAGNPFRVVNITRNSCHKIRSYNAYYAKPKGITITRADIVDLAIDPSKPMAIVEV